MANGQGQQATTPGRGKGWVLSFLFITALVAVAWLIRIVTPANFSGDQMKPMGYVLDILRAGNWIVQSDFAGSVTSKPPLHTWLTAFSAMAFSRLSVVSMYLPTGLAMLGTALTATWMARHWFGVWAGFLAGIFVVFTSLGLRHLAFARTDALFTFFITLAALCALRAWADRASPRWWLGFWIACAFAVLTKGPLGILLAGFGLAAAIWERRSHSPDPLQGTRRERGILHLAGVLTVVILGGGWFLLAYLGAGQALIDKQITAELIGHATKGPRPLPIGYFLSSFAPWSFFAAYGIYRTIRFPASRTASRRAERFLVLWIVLGVLLFCLSSHQRHDHLLPLVAPMAVLASREIARLSATLPDRRRALLALVLVLSLVAIEAAYYGTKIGRVPDVAQSDATVRLAAEVRALEARDGRLMPVTFFKAPSTLEFALERKPGEPTEAALRQLLDGGQPVFVATNGAAALSDISPPGGSGWQVWFPGWQEGKFKTGTILSTLPPGTIPDSGAFVIDDLILRFDGAGYQGRSFGTVLFRSYGPATIRVENTGDTDRPLRIRDLADGRRFDGIVPRNGTLTVKLQENGAN